MTRRSNIRHHGSGGGGTGPAGSGIPSSGAAIFGSALIWDWSVPAGSNAGVPSWTDQKASRVLTQLAPTMSFATDGSNFRGQSVWQNGTTGVFADDGAGPTVLPSGATSFYAACVFRLKTVAAPAGVGALVQVSDNAFVLNPFQISLDGTGANWQAVLNTGTVTLNIAATDTSVHRAEMWLSGGVLFAAMDGAIVSTGTGLTLTGDTQSITLGGGCAIAEAHVLVASSSTPTQRAQARAADALAYGTT